MYICVHSFSPQVKDTQDKVNPCPLSSIHTFVLGLYGTSRPIRKSGKFSKSEQDGNWTFKTFKKKKKSKKEKKIFLFVYFFKEIGYVKYLKI